MHYHQSEINFLMLCHDFCYNGLSATYASCITIEKIKSIFEKEFGFAILCKNMVGCYLLGWNTNFFIQEMIFEY